MNIDANVAQAGGLQRGAYGRFITSAERVRQHPQNGTGHDPARVSSIEDAVSDPFQKLRPPRGRDGLILYLDFDGVLHHENCLWSPKLGPYLCAPARYTLFQHAELLAQLLAPYPEVLIVLSTTWIRRYGVAASAKRLPEGLQKRVIGGTFHSRHMREDEFQHLLRGQQVFHDVQRRRPRDWLALDDDGEGWPAAHLDKFIQTHMYEGLGDPEILSTFTKKLDAMCNHKK
jgi:hypothetical protein